MATNVGIDNIKENLVFGYDTGYGIADNDTPTRLYTGESTTNLFAYPYLSNHTSTTSGTTSIVKENFGDGKKGVRFTQASTSPILSFAPALPGTPVSGGTYTWSSYVHSTSTGSKLKSQVTVYVNGVRHWLTNTNTWSTSTVECNHLFKATVANEWHRVDNQITMPTGTLTSFSAGGFYRSTSNFTIKVANLQFEQKGHVTPFTDSSRGTDKCLLDLNRTATVELQNLSFDSTGQPTFDGTNDYIDATVNSITNATSLTISYWFKMNWPSGWSPFVTLMDSNGTQKFHTWFGNDRGIDFQTSINSVKPMFVASSTNYPNNEYINVVMVINGSGTNNVKCYVNAIYKAQGSLSFNTHDIDKLRIGRDPGNAYGGGHMPRLAIYNVPLTEPEISQNFNAYKNRFNL
jgi:hypothetical protein